MAAMFNKIRECEGVLAAMHRRKHCVLTGRGAASLWMIYRLLPAGRRGIILPATLCLSPWCVARMLDRPVYFADVRKEDGTIDPGSAGSILRAHDDVGLILAANIYGNLVQIDDLMCLCREHDVLLVEDVAQALGGQYPDGRIFGECADLAVLSFGHTKILDAGGGGAVLTDDDAMADELRKLAGALPARLADDSIALSGEYSSLYYSIWRCSRLEPAAIKMFSYFPGVFKGVYLLSATKEMAERILGVLPALPAELERRRNTVKAYCDVFSPLPSVEILTQLPGAPWRFTFLVPERKREFILEATRAKGFDISSWYAPVASWCLDNGGTTHIPVAEMLAKRVINLWVSGEYKERWRDVAQCVASMLSESWEE